MLGTADGLLLFPSLLGLQLLLALLLCASSAAIAHLLFYRTMNDIEELAQAVIRSPHLKDVIR